MCGSPMAPKNVAMMTPYVAARGCAPLVPEVRNGESHDSVDDGGVSEHRGVIRSQVVTGAVPGRDQQHDRRNADRAQLQPVLKALDEGDSLHPAHGDVAAHDHTER